MLTTSVRTFWIASIAGALVGGCAVAPVEAPPPAPPRDAPTVPAPHPVRQEPAAAAPPAPTPPPAAAPPPPAPEPERVLVLLPSRTDAFTAVLPDLEAELEVRNLDASHATIDDLRASAVDAAPTVVIAVGSDATRAALDDLEAPVVFCQVSDRRVEAPGAYGVASLPPLELQLKAWRRLDPTLRTIGLVLGRDETSLAARARNAANAHGLVLELQLASSDQEALYHFKRMAPGVDGLWILPDNTALSPRAIREMLAIAAARNVQTLVFTPSLLDWGALLSISATDLDLARTLAKVVHALADDRGDEIPPLTSLTELEVRVNVSAAERLGLDPPRDVWIERSGAP